MSSLKRPALPVILLANDLLDGDIMFWNGKAWSVHLADAIIATDEEAAEQLQAVANEAVGANKIVDADIVSVMLEKSGKLRPCHIRERIKALGPTIRLDLGKQACLTQDGR